MPHLSIAETKKKEIGNPYVWTENALNSNALNGPVQSDTGNDSFFSPRC